LRDAWRRRGTRLKAAAGVKKLHWHTTFGVIAVEEPLRRVGTRIERPFSERAGVDCRATSLPLQRVLADFGAEVAFGRVPDKLREHYGITMPVSTIQRTTERHAGIIHEQAAAQEVTAGTAAGLFIGEIDGSMVPVVETSPAAGDQRKGKTLCWKEVRRCLVHPQGGATPVFGGHFAGGVEESGRQWARGAAKAGFGPASHLQAVGDDGPASACDRYLRTRLS
jgi:hypothetical protein